MLAKRPCPECKIPLTGIQVGLDPDWQKFECRHCEEITFENVKYCINIEDTPVATEI